MKFLLFFALAAIAIWCCKPLLRMRSPDRFTIDHLATDYRGHFLIEEENGTAQNILSSLVQEGTVFFDYLGHGSQMIAFSKKGTPYVLKLLLARETKGPKKGRLPSPLRLIPSYRKKREAENQIRREERLHQVLKAYALSFEHIKEESGLISIHLHPTKHLFPRCIVRDQYGTEHSIDLDRSVFILQKKLELLSDRFATSTTPAQYQQSIAAMQKLFETHIRKGVADLNDRFKIENYGFIGDQAYFLDPGRASYSESIKADPEPEIARMNEFLFSWLRGKSPAPEPLPH